MSQCTGLPLPHSSCLRLAKCATKFNPCVCFVVHFVVNMCSKASPHFFSFCLCLCLQQPVLQSWKTWAFSMSSATPPCGHPFACPGIIQEEGHLRTPKVTVLWVIDVDLEEATREMWKNTSAKYLCCNFVHPSVSHVCSHTFTVRGL